MANILAVGTALPGNKICQNDIKRLIANIFDGQIENLDRFLSVFDNGLIESRYLSVPIDWFLSDHSFSERNEIYHRVALELSIEAAKTALAKSQVDLAEIGAICFVSSTGLATPSLDSFLIKQLGLSKQVTRLPIWGLGCAGGVAGLNRAADFCRAYPNKYVLLVAVELCSLTFQKNDLSKANFVASSLFADGAAAVVLGPNTKTAGLKVIAGQSTLFDDTEDVMGWDIYDHGFQVRFSRDIPMIIKTLLKDDVTEFLHNNHLDIAQIDHFITHPGGLKALQAFAQALDLPIDKFDHSFSVLKNFGNMSSASVLFVLDKFMNDWTENSHQAFGLISAMGPGFSTEHSLIRF